MVSKTNENQEDISSSESKPRLKLTGNLTKLSIQEWEKGTKSTIFDNNNVYLRRRKKANVWMLRYKLGSAKTWKTMCLGKYSERNIGGLSLLACREKYYYEILPQLEKSLNPRTERYRTREENSIQTSLTFEKAYSDWYRDNKDIRWRTERNAEKLNARFKKNVIPQIGKMSCVSITVSDLRKKVFEPLLSERKFATCEKLITYFAVVWRKLFIDKKVKEDITRELKDWLSGEFKSRKATEKRTNFPAITEWRMLGEFMCDVEDYFSDEKIKGNKASIKTYYAYLLLAHTAVRPHNAVSARGSNFFNLEGGNAFWRIPREELKVSKTDLKVPLSPQIIKHLREYKKWCEEQEINSDFLFASSSQFGHMTVENLEKFFRQRGYRNKMTPHGFRSSFSTLCNKNHSEWFLPVELCLNHQPNTQIGGIYNRAGEDWLIKERRDIYKWWGSLLEKNLADTRARRAREQTKKKES